MPPVAPSFASLNHLDSEDWYIQFRHSAEETGKTFAPNGGGGTLLMMISMSQKSTTPHPSARSFSSKCWVLQKTVRAGK